MIFTVLTFRLEETMKLLAKIEKKAKKYGCDDISFKTVAERKELRTRVVDDVMTKVEVSVSDIEVTGFDTAPKVGEYDFIARIDFEETGNLIFNISGKDLPEHFRTTDCGCDHCNVNISRNSVYVVADKDGKLLQVGKSCLQDFVGTKTPEQILRKFGFLQDIKTAMEEGSFFSFGSFTYLTEEFLMVSLACIKLYGFVGKSSADETKQPTASAARDYFDRQGKGAAKYRAEINAAIQENGFDKIATQVRGELMNSDDCSEFAYNLRTILYKDVINHKHVGYVAAAANHYFRQKAKAAEPKKISGGYIGSIGDKISAHEVTVTNIRAMDTAWGVSTLYKFVDAAGNIMSWFASNGAQGLDIGSKAVIKAATIKALKEFNNVKETQLTRVKIERK